jgi:hypothetical protein
MISDPPRTGSSRSSSSGVLRLPHGTFREWPAECTCPARAAHHVVPADAVRTVKRVLNELTLPGADAIRADARRFRQLVRSDAVRARAATLFARGRRPAARSNSTSAPVSDPCNRKKESRWEGL